jgi:hypothetical protein
MGRLDSFARWTEEPSDVPGVRARRSDVGRVCIYEQRECEPHHEVLLDGSTVLKSSHDDPSAALELLRSLGIPL